MQKVSLDTARQIETVAQRRNLSDHTIYTVRMAEGVYLGYRKGKGKGTWFARARDAENGRYREERLGRVESDIHPADGDGVLDFAQATAALWKVAAKAGVDISAHRNQYTVNEALDDYLDDRRSHGTKSVYDIKRHIENDIRPMLGNKLIRTLTPQDIRRLRNGVANRKPRLSGGKVRETFDPRARRVSANKVLTTAKAALNLAFENGLVETDAAWRRVKPFKNVDKPRVQFLSDDDCLRLLNACDSDFRNLVLGARYTGARYGELCRLLVSDYRVIADPDDETIEIGEFHIRESKSGQPRFVPLTPEGKALFDRLTAGRAGDDYLFVRADGLPWQKNQQVRRMKDACERAKITPAVTFHGLRDTFATNFALSGESRDILRELGGWADNRTPERYYIHVDSMTKRRAMQGLSILPGVEPVDPADNVERFTLKRRKRRR